MVPEVWLLLEPGWKSLKGTAVDARSPPECYTEGEEEKGPGVTGGADFRKVGPWNVVEKGNKDNEGLCGGGVGRRREVEERKERHRGGGVTVEGLTKRAEVW